ncbi:MAG: hypothetical protein SNH27_07485 [Rikenellaceae bacterium]
MKDSPKFEFCPQCGEHNTHLTGTYGIISTFDEQGEWHSCIEVVVKCGYCGWERPTNEKGEYYE